MADDLPDAAFWLPSDFLTDADILSDFSFSAPENETSEDDDLRAFSSPQSTLLGFESKNSVSSLGSPNDEKKDDTASTLDLLKRAAGEVAKMKVTANGGIGTGFFDCNYSGETLFYPAKQPSPFSYRNYPSEMMRGAAAPQQQQQSKVSKKKNKKNNGNNRTLTLGLPQSAWPPLPGKAQSQAQAQSQPMTGRLMVLKRESVGTGVFLPRHVTSPAQPNHKPDGTATKTKSDKGSQLRISRQTKANQDDIRLPPEWVY